MSNNFANRERMLVRRMEHVCSVDQKLTALKLVEQSCSCADLTTVIRKLQFQLFKISSLLHHH
jgi:cob(I)alamin adenosyltransferase